MRQSTLRAAGARAPGQTSFVLLPFPIARAITLGGDIKKDGTVNLNVLVLLALAFGSKLGDPNWNPSADMNGDGKVSLPDLVILARNYC